MNSSTGAGKAEEGKTKVRYDGSACLNVRSVGAACKVLQGALGPDEPLSWDDFSSVLWFVETCVTSKNLFFDGTVPKETAEQASKAVGQLKAAHELKDFEVSPIQFDDPRKTLAAAGDALAESRLLIDHFQIEPQADKSVTPEEHERFVREFAAVRTLPEAERQAIALDWVADGFRGSKCLAALVANGENAFVAAQRIYEEHSKEGPLVTGALINRFRLNYVNQLASEKQSAYVPDPSFERITQEHVRLFKDYLLERIVKRLEPKPEEGNILIENMKAETPLPPLGLYALMATRATNRPGAILETAYNEFRQDDRLMKLIWANTKGGIALKKTSTDDYVAEINQYFYDKYKMMEKQGEGIQVPASKGRKARAYLIPAVLKGLAKAIPEALGVGKAFDAVWAILRETGVEASIPFLSDKLLSEDCDSYVSQYKNLKWDLQHDDAVHVPLAKLSEQAERVFGRRLA